MKPIPTPIFALLSTLLFVWCGHATARCITAQQTQRFGAEKYWVEKVHDGDTIVVRPHNNNDVSKPITVRMLGVNTPEKRHRTTGLAEPLATAATDFVVQRIARTHHRVELLIGHRTQDSYGRTLAWVVVGGELLSEQLIENGLGYQVATFEDTRFVDCLAAAQAQARARRLGVWSATEINVRYQVPTGFAVITGRAVAVSESKRYHWVNLDGDLVLQFSKQKWRSHATFIRNLVGKRIVAQGWIRPRYKPSKRYKNHILPITHPAMLSLS